MAERGTPEWWLDRLTRKIIAKQPRYDKLEDYFMGDHPLPYGDQRYVQALKDLQEKARTNYFSLVTMAPVERMSIAGFRYGPSDSVDETASQLWEVNDMETQSSLLHLMCAVFGDAYVLVLPPDEPSGLPRITVEDPRFCAVEMDPGKPGVVYASLKIWEDSIVGKILAVLTLPEGFYYFVGPDVLDVQGLDTPTLTNRLLSQTTGFTLAGYAPNYWGVQPMVRFQWQFGFGDTSQGEAEGVIDIQDRINGEILNRLVIARSQAYKQRMISGVKLADDKRRGKRPPFDPGADMLWVVQDPNAKMFEFKEADISQLLKAIRDDVGDMAAVTKTPPHYLMGEVVNVSGDALKAAETGLVSKVRQRMRSVGPSWERVIRAAFKYMNIGQEEPGKVLRVLWSDPESKSRAELADAMSKEIGSGIPLQLAMARANFTPQEIEFAVSERKKEQLRAATLQAITARGEQRPQGQSKGSESAAGASEDDSGSEPSVEDSEEPEDL